jgi:gluconolactonase
MNFRGEMKMKYLILITCLCIPTFSLHAQDTSNAVTTSEVELVANKYPTVIRGRETVANIQFCEGPVWIAEGFLLFTDIPANKILKWDETGGLTVWRDDSGMANGLAQDREGRLISSEHGNRRVARTEHDGSITVIAETIGGKRFNSPNDVTVRSDGMLYFTDPSYGLSGRPAELSEEAVYRVMPGEDPVKVAGGFSKPNGIAFSPDESFLYIADTAKAHVRVFTVNADGSLSGDTVFASMGNPDGMKVDVEGNLYVTSASGVVVYNPQGELIETIVVPQQPANCGFGGADFKTLYITARTALYKVRTRFAGTNQPVKSGVDFWKAVK